MSRSFRSRSHRESQSRTEKHRSSSSRVDASHSFTKESNLPRFDRRRRRGWNSARSEELETAAGRRTASTDPRLALCCARCENPLFCFALRRDRPDVIQCDMVMKASDSIYSASQWIRIWRNNRMQSPASFLIIVMFSRRTTGISARIRTKEK
jgi:hypothetical protein